MGLCPSAVGVGVQIRPTNRRQKQGVTGDERQLINAATLQAAADGEGDALQRGGTLRFDRT